VPELHPFSLSSPSFFYGEAASASILSIHPRTRLMGSHGADR
jgi:hypothetical protein